MRNSPDGGKLRATAGRALTDRLDWFRINSLYMIISNVFHKMSGFLNKFYEFHMMNFHGIFTTASTK